MTSSRLTISSILALAVLFVGVLPGAATAVCESDAYEDVSPILLGGESSGEGTGTGGTGRPLSIEQVDRIEGNGDDSLDPGEGSGAGGTGLRPGGDEGSGAGGTGILGTITGFGSICVNGLRVEYEHTTPVQRDGEEIGADALEVGHVVRVETRPGKRLFAKRIVVENSLSGPVTRVDRAGDRIWVMEQPVDVPPGVGVRERARGPVRGIDRLKPGQRVAVAGQRRPDGVVVASHVGARSDRRPDSVIGPAVPTGEATTYVAEVRATLREPSRQPVRGARVAVRGRWNSQTRTLESAEVDTASLDRQRGARLSIEGYVDESRNGGDFEIAGTPIVASRFERAPQRGQRITIEGRIDDQGRLRAERMRWRRDGRPDRETPVVHEGDDSDRGDRGERSGRSGSGRSDRGEREDRSGREERSDRESRSEREGRADRTEREDRAAREDRSGRSGRD